MLQSQLFSDSQLSKVCNMYLFVFLIDMFVPQNVSYDASESHQVNHTLLYHLR